jgi:hypothetical protein
MRRHFGRALIAILIMSFLGIGACVIRSGPPGHRRHYVSQKHKKHKQPKKHKHAKHKKHKKHKR